MNPLRSIRIWSAVLAVAVGTAVARLSAEDAPPKPPEAVSTAELTSEGKVVDLTPEDPAKETETAKTTAEKPAKRKSKSTKGNPAANEVVSVGASEKVPKGKKVDEVVVVGGDATVDGDVEGDVVVVGGTVRVNGHVKGDVVNVGFGAHLGPEASVDGDVVGIGGGVFKADGATVKGEVIPVGISTLPGFGQGLPAWLDHYFHDGFLKLRPLMFSTDAPWTVFGILFLLHFLVAALLPSASKGVERTLVERPGATALMAVLAIPLGLFALILLSITLIGPVAFIAAVLIAVLVGKVAILQFLGGRITAAFGNPNLLPIVRFVIGAFLVTLLYATPYIGFFVWFALSLWGLGAATLALFGREGSRKKADAMAPPAAAAFAGGSGTTEGIRLASEVPGGMAFAAPAAATVTGTTVSAIPEVPTAGTPPSPGIPEASATTATASAAAPRPDGGFGSGPAPSGNPGFQRQGGPGSFRDSTTDWLRQAAQPGLSAAEIESLPRPTFLPRAGALILDYVVVGLLFALLPDFLHDSGPGPFLLVAASYHALMVAWRGASLGGLVFRFQVIRLDGRPLDRATALVRAASAILSTIPCGLGWFWVLWDPERQGWHDKLAGTVVVQGDKTRSLV